MQYKEKVKEFHRKAKKELEKMEKLQYKTIILLDLSRSFRGTDEFMEALKQIEKELTWDTLNSVEVYGFGNKEAKLGYHDIQDLYLAYDGDTDLLKKLDSKISRELGEGTNFDIMEFLRKLQRENIYLRISRAIIYSDFWIYNPLEGCGEGKSVYDVPSNVEVKSYDDNDEHEQIKGRIADLEEQIDVLEEQIDVLEDVLEDELGDLQDFVQQIEEKLEELEQQQPIEIFVSSDNEDKEKIGDKLVKW